MGTRKEMVNCTVLTKEIPDHFTVYQKHVSAV